MQFLFCPEISVCGLVYYFVTRSRVQEMSEGKGLNQRFMVHRLSLKPSALYGRLLNIFLIAGSGAIITIIVLSRCLNKCFNLF